MQPRCIWSNPESPEPSLSSTCQILCSSLWKSPESVCCFLLSHCITLARDTVSLWANWPPGQLIPGHSPHGSQTYFIKMWKKFLFQFWFLIAPSVMSKFLHVAYKNLDNLDLPDLPVSFLPLLYALGKVIVYFSLWTSLDCITPFPSQVLAHLALLTFWISSFLAVGALPAFQGVCPPDGGSIHPLDNEKCRQILPDVPRGPTSSPIENYWPMWTNPARDFIYQMWQKFWKIHQSSLSFPNLLTPSLRAVQGSSRSLLMCKSKTVGNPVFFFGFIKISVFPLSMWPKMVCHHHSYSSQQENKNPEKWVSLSLISVWPKSTHHFYKL